MKKQTLAALERERKRRAEEQATLNRDAFAALPSSPQKQRLRLRILETAFWLFDEGSTRAIAQGDALLEFMSDEDARKLLDQFFETEKPFDPSEFQEGSS